MVSVCLLPAAWLSAHTLSRACACSNPHLSKCGAFHSCVLPHHSIKVLTAFVPCRAAAAHVLTGNIEVPVLIPNATEAQMIAFEEEVEDMSYEFTARRLKASGKICG